MISEKNRWNNDLPTMIKELCYTRDEIDTKYEHLNDTGVTTVIVTYTNGTSETIDLLRRG